LGDVTTAPITIAGAGIAGLTAALCLRRQAVPITIIEKQKAVTTEGAGIQITPNAFRVLDQLGLGARLTSSGYPVGHLGVFDGGSGDLITIVPFGAIFTKNHRTPYLVIKRQALLDILLEEALAQNIEIRFDTPYRRDDYAPDATIIGADGIWSAVRAEVTAQTAIFSGKTAFRCMIASGRAPQWCADNDLAMWLANKAHFVAYPVDEARTLNLVCVVTSEKPEKHWSTSATAAEILNHLNGWNKPVSDLVETSENWQRWPLYVMPPEHAWTKGNKVLIGDAAHGMAPFLAQGGAMAIEDAAVLATTLSQTADRQEAFRRFQTSRWERVHRVWHEAKTNGERYHWSGMMAKARNLGLKALGGEHLQRRYQWIYGWTPPRLGANITQN